MSRKKTLLKAAKALFAEYGYEGTTFKKISESAGVALGLLAYHYTSKDKLFFAASMDVLEQLYNRLEEKSGLGKNGLEKAMLFIKAYFDFTLEPDACYILLIRCSPYSIIEEEYSARMSKSHVSIHTLLEKLITLGKEDGSILHPGTACAITNVIICTVNGGCRNRMMLTPFAPPTLYSDIVRHIHRSLSAPTLREPESEFSWETFSGKAFQCMLPLTHFLANTLFIAHKGFSYAV